MESIIANMMTQLHTKQTTFVNAQVKMEPTSRKKEIKKERKKERKTDRDKCMAWKYTANVWETNTASISRENTLSMSELVMSQSVQVTDLQFLPAPRILASLSNEMDLFA